MPHDAGFGVCPTCGLAQGARVAACPRCGRSLRGERPGDVTTPDLEAPRTPEFMPDAHDGRTVKRTSLVGLQAEETALESNRAEAGPASLQGDPPVSAADSMSPAPAPFPLPSNPMLPVGVGLPMAGARPAQVGTRFAAALLDALVVWVALLVVYAVVGLVLLAVGSNRNSGLANAVGVLMSLVYFAAIAGLVGYYVLSIGRIGQTIGKRIVGISVVDAATGQSIGAGRAFVRYLGLGLMGLPCYLGYLSILLDKSGMSRGWHDSMAGSVVVAGQGAPVGQAVRDVCRAVAHR